MILQLEMPWPDKILSPNARPHYHAKAKAVKEHRAMGYWATKANLKAPVPDGEVMVSLIFHPPSKRRFDIDGLVTRSKAYLDGIADALEINDYRFALTVRRGNPITGGLVRVEI